MAIMLCKWSWGVYLCACVYAHVFVFNTLEKGQTGVKLQARCL